MKKTLHEKREDTYKGQFNQFWNGCFKTSEKNYYSLLTVEDYVELKKTVGCINNIITLKASLLFVDYLNSIGFISNESALQIKERISSSSANANGFDIVFDSETNSFLAEVKCNIPACDNRFGSTQASGIIKDLKHLSTGKNKGIRNTNSYFKFMVILKTGKSEEAMEQLMKEYNMRGEGLKVLVIPKDKSKLVVEAIYVVFIDVK